MRRWSGVFYPCPRLLAAGYHRSCCEIGISSSNHPEQRPSRAIIVWTSLSYRPRAILRLGARSSGILSFRSPARFPYPCFKSQCCRLSHSEDSDTAAHQRSQGSSPPWSPAGTASVVSSLGLSCAAWSSFRSARSEARVFVGQQQDRWAETLLLFLRRGV